jgi:hypothetical protein
MPETPSPQKRAAGQGLLLGGTMLAMIACRGLPLLVAALGSVAIGTLLGVGGGILAAVALVTIAVIPTPDGSRRSRARPSTPAGQRAPARFRLATPILRSARAG